jgi:hypothetical protein
MDEPKMVRVSFVADGASEGQNPSWLTILRCGYVCSVGFHIRINAVFGHVDLLDAFLYIGLEILLCCVYKSLLFGKAWLVKW